MFKKDKSKKTKSVYERVTAASKIASPILRALYYIAVVVAVLIFIIALILLFVNVSVSEMLLPPYMHETDTGYSISIGNGIRIDALYEDVTLGDIKNAIFAELLLFGASLCVFAPISLFLSKIFKNLADGELYRLKNSRYMMYIGITVAVGYSFLGTVRDFYNYLLVKTFVTVPETVHLSMRPGLGGIFAGLLIVILAFIYSVACEKHFSDEAAHEQGCADITEA